MLISLSGKEAGQFDDYTPDNQTQDQAILVSLHDFGHARRHTSHTSAALIGLSVDGDTPFDEISNVLSSVAASVAMIQINFPTFMDGRGFSLAALIRRSGFTGELRASGPLMPDQGWHLVRCGFDTLLLEKPERAAAFEASVARFAFAYQKTYRDTAPIPVRRHSAAEHSETAS